jgi:flagellar secretion chaperone FliS
MNLPSKGLARYGAVSVTTSSPGQILLMLYDGLFRFLREAMTGMATKDRACVTERTSRSLAILEQFILGLDRGKFPALCDNLLPLYEFCMSQIVLGNGRQDPAPLGEVIRVLLPLREAWGVAVEQLARDEMKARGAAAQETAKTG